MPGISSLTGHVRVMASMLMLLSSLILAQSTPGVAAQPNPQFLKLSGYVPSAGGELAQAHAPTMGTLTVSGYVRTPAGAPVWNSTIYFALGPYGPGPQATTDVNGYYTFSVYTANAEVLTVCVGPSADGVCWYGYTAGYGESITVNFGGNGVYLPLITS